MLLTYSLTKAKRTLCDVAQFVADLLGCSSRVQKLLTTVMTRIVFDKGTDYAKPYSICFFATISKLTKEIFVLTTENTDSDLKVHALYYANEYFQLLQYSRQHPSIPAHWADRMTKPDSTFQNFFLRIVDFEVQSIPLL